MYHIKKIIAIFTAIYCSHSFAQEAIMLPDDVWKPIITRALIVDYSSAWDIITVSKQLCTVIKIPAVIKTALAERESKNPASLLRKLIPKTIIEPYIEANEKLLRTLELTFYQEEILKNPYADINYEAADQKNKLIMLCSDYPEYKFSWITWLIEHGARDNNAHPQTTTALGAIIKWNSIERHNRECKWHETYGTCSFCLNVKNKCYTIAEILIQKGGSDPSKHIHAAIDARDPDIVQLLITHGATIKKYDYEWFHDYLAKGNIDENALEFLLDQGYKPYKHGDRFDGTAYFGHCYLELENAIQTVMRLAPSPKRDRILNLMQQYPKKKA